MSMWLSDETDLPVANSSLSPDQQVVVGIRPQDVHVVESDGPTSYTPQSLPSSLCRRRDFSPQRSRV